MQDLPGWLWIVFAAAFGVMLAVDLIVHRGLSHESRRRALVWTLTWIAAGFGFWLFLWIAAGSEIAHEYLAVYTMEKSLSLDNLFLFLLVFNTLQIPREYQRTALSWGIFGALTFRAVLIFAGVRAVERWGWLEYVFAALLFYAAWQAYREDPATREESRAVRWLSDRLPVSRERHTAHFIIRQNGRRLATPLLVAVLGIELSDVIFAVDSVTVALSITRNEFLIYSANAFAILGLRALYIFMAQTIVELRYLHYGLAAVLAFAGLKMALGEGVQISPLLSVGIIVAAMGIAAWASARARRGDGEAPERKSGRAA